MEYDKDHIRSKIERVLREHGVGDTPDENIHSWRCAWPDRYGECKCLEELVNDMWEMVEQHEY